LPGHVVKYAPTPAGDRLHQGEILGGLVLVRQVLGSIGTQDVEINEVTVPLAVLLTQDCELEQDATARALEAQASANPDLLIDADVQKKHSSAPKYKVDSVVFCELVPTANLKASAAQQKELWKRVTQNLDPRFHCLEEVPLEGDSRGEGLPSMGCDFKRFFTVPTDEVYKRMELEQIVRRCYLSTPYAEHLLQRFCNFLARIPLPENHDVSL
jgi:hypothetical protein